MVQHFAEALLKGRLGPLRLLVMIEDLEGRVARGRAPGLGGADVKRVANDRVVRRLHRHARQQLGVAGQNGGQSRIDVQPGLT